VTAVHAMVAVLVKAGRNLYGLLVPVVLDPSAHSFHHPFHIAAAAAVDSRVTDQVSDPRRRRTLSSRHRDRKTAAVDA